MDAARLPLQSAPEQISLPRIFEAVGSAQDVDGGGPGGEPAVDMKGWSSAPSVLADQRRQRRIMLDCLATKDPDVQRLSEFLG